MCKMYGIIQSLCTERGIKIGKMCAECGISRGVMGDLKAGRTKKLSAENLSKISTYFGVTTDYLLCQETKKSPDTKSGEEIPHSKMRQVLSEGGIRVYLDEDANVPQENLEDIIKYIKLRQRDVGR